MSFEEWSNNKKKKKNPSSFEEWSNATRGVSKEREEEDEKKRQAYLAQQSDDIAPVRSSEDRTWFKKSEGDVWQTLRGSTADVDKNLTRGFLGMGEKIADFAAGLSAVMVQGQLNQSASDEMLFNALTGKKDEKVLERYQGIQEEIDKGAADFIAKDLYDEEAIAERLVLGRQKNKGVDIEAHSVFGEKSDALVASGGELLGQIGVSMIPGVGQVGGTMLMGASAFGSEMESALQNGATFDEALLSGTISATAEMLTEKIGGVKFGGKTLTDAAFGALSSKVTSKFARYLISTGKIAADASAEAIEEVVSGYVSAWGQKLTYMDDKEIEELFTKEDALESAIGGFVLGGGFSVGETAISGRDAASGLTKNEQAVVDKVAEDTVSAKEADGKKLSDKEKAKIRESVVERMEKGQIDLDTIDSMFGGESYTSYRDALKGLFEGDTYKSYKKALEEEEALTKEIEELAKKEPATPADNFRYTELMQKQSEQAERKAQIEAEAQRIIEMRSNLRSEIVKKLGADSKLVESYREEARSHQKFKADPTKYKGEYAQKTIQSLVDSGLANDTREFHEVADWLAQMAEEKGVVFNLTDKKALKGTRYEHKGRTTNAYFNEATGDVVLNVDSERPLNSSVGHELGHVLKGIDANLYEEFKANFKAWANNKNGEWDARYKATAEVYAKRDEDGNIIRDENGNIVFINNGVNIDDEVCNDLIGDYIFTDKDFIKHLSVKQPNAFKHFWDEIKYMVKVAKAGTKVEKELLALEKQFAEIWRETGKYQPKTTEATQQAQNIQNSLSIKHTDGTVEEIADARNLTNEQAVEYLNQAKSGRITGHSYIPVRKDTPQVIIDTLSQVNEEVKNRSLVMQVSKAQQAMSVTKGSNRTGKYGDNVRGHALSPEQIVEIVNKLDDPSLIIYQTNRHGKNGKELPNNVAVFVEYNNNGTESVAVIEFDSEIDPEAIGTEFGDTEFHTVVTVFEPDVVRDGEPFDYAEELLSNPDNILLETKRRQSTGSATREIHPNTSSKLPSGDSIAPIPENVNTELSISSDSEGTQLSDGQIEYFADSKVRDENGNLKVMYHGTPSGDFTVFRDGTYFTENKWYADLYQNPGASSINSRKTVTNPKTYKVYLDIKKPFDIADAEAREIYINEYIKGGNAVGINPYLSDAEYEKITSIDWTEGEDLREFLIDNGYDYDGLVLDEGAVGGYGDDVKYRGKSYVIFSPEQIKDVDNKTPTVDPDINFSLSKSVEETRDLMALHNMKADELLKTLELGGLPMPSIAVIKAQQGHEKYGDVSLIFPKHAIDPQASSDNKIYGGDAWTPVYPRIEYKANEAVQERVRKKYYDLAEKYGYDAVRPLYRYAHELESALNSEQGEANLLDWLYKDTKLMQIYLEDSGKGKVEDIVKETRTEASESDKQMSQWFIDKLGEDFIRAFKTPKGESPLSYRKNYIEAHKAEIASAWESFCREVFQITEEQVQNVMRDTNGAMYMKFMRDAEQYLNNGGVTIKTETDYDATERAIEEKAADGYKEWVDSLFKGAEEKTGIRNDKDAYTNSGNRRSWDALHWSNTLENVVKAMKAQDQTGADAFSPVSAIFAVAHKRYNSIGEVKADSNRLGRVSEDEYKAMEGEYASRLAEIAKSIQDPNESNPFIANDHAAQLIIDAVRSYKTKAGMLRYMQKWNSRVTESTVNDILSLVSDIANMPTGYFEAKPQRAVGLEEVGVFVIPRNADVKLKQELLNRGYSIAEYDPDVEGDRQKVVNQFEQYKFSLSDAGKQGGGDMPAPVGNYYVYGKDIKYTPQEDIAPVSTNTPTAQANTPTVGETIGEKPAVPTSERIADGRRSDELLLDSLDNHPVQTIEQKIEEKIRALHGEIADIKDLRREKWDDYESRIADLRAKYNSKKNKNTKEAIGILQSISRLERMKASDDADFSKRISDREARVERMNDPKYARAMRKHAKMEADAKWAADLLGDTSTWIDKKLGLQYATNTERRNLRDIVRDANGNEDIAHADAIDDALNGQYNRDEASKKRELAKVRDKYAKLKITRAEDVYIQMLGEFRHNPDTTLTEEDIKEYYEKHKGKIDTEKVDKVIEMARQDYDDFLNRVNAELKKQGMKEIPYRQGYFPHFTEPKQNFIQKLLNWKTQDNEIPTSIAGLTETFKPTKSWQSFDKTRHSDETDFSFMKGFDSYSEGALDWIYHMDTLQKRRAVENHIRFTHSDEGIQARIKEVYANEEIDANEAQARIEEILSEAKNPLNNFVQDFTTHTNILAGKKNSLDRTVEQWTNRHIYSVMTNVQNRMSANMVLANVRSALTNFIPITQSWAQVSPLRSLQAAKETIANSFKDDGTVDKSTFLTNRLREVDRLYQTNWDKVLDKAGIMFEIVDNFSSQVIWRSKYNQNLAKGMSEAEAIRNADQFAENVMAGRSKGNEPTLFNAKNPLVKAFTMFQLEVNNQYGYLFKDVPHDLKAETNHWKFNLAKGYTTAFIGAYVYNALFEKLTGGEAALDPIGIIEELLRDLGLFDDDEEKEPDKVVTNLVDNVVEELPFVGGLFGGGRIPISSAIPYSGEGFMGGVQSFAEDAGKTVDAIGKTIKGDFDEADWSGAKNFGKEMMNPLLNVGLPVAGGQLKKSIQGLKMFSDDHPVTGSYTDSGSLRFPVEKTPLNVAQAAIFGQYASKNAREYFDNEYAPLNEKQIQEYIDVDIPISDYWEYRKGLNDLAPLPGKKSVTANQKIDYISGLDLPTYKKNILANNVLDRKDPVDLENYEDYGSLEEFDFATEYPGKHALAKAVGGYSTYKTYSEELYDIKADKDANGKSISGSRKEKVIDYINNLNADYHAKILLLKYEYPSDDTYNGEIVNFIVNNSSLSYDERVAILTELGFRVTADGQIYDD